MTTDELWQQFFFHLQARRRTPATLRYSANTQTVFGRYMGGTWRPTGFRKTLPPSPFAPAGLADLGIQR